MKTIKFISKYFYQFLTIFFFFILFYIYYRSEIVHNGNRIYFYKPYYTIVTLLILTSFLVIFIKPKLKQYITIVFISVVMSLYLFEIYLVIDLTEQNIKKNLILRKSIQGKEIKEVSEKIVKSKIYKKSTGYEYDTRSKLEVFEDQKKINKNIKLLIYPHLYIEDSNEDLFPMSGISNSETIYCNENGYYLINKTDRYGFNNPDGEWEKKETKYILIGDSYTQGFCVERPHDIASVLRKNNDNKSVINLGYGGTGPIIQYATLKEYIKPKTENVLWFFYEGNDLIDLFNESTNEILKKYVEDPLFNQNLKNKQKEINLLVNNKLKIEINKIKKNKLDNLEKEQKITSSFDLRKFIKLYNTRKILIKPKEPTGYKFQKIAELINELCKKNNTKLFFIYLPEYNRYYLKDYKNKDYKKIENIIKNLNIPFIDINTKIFLKESNPLNFFPFALPEGHYTKQGFAKVAEVVDTFVKEY